MAHFDQNRMCVLFASWSNLLGPLILHYQEHAFLFIQYYKPIVETPLSSPNSQWKLKKKDPCEDKQMWDRSDHKSPELPCWLKVFKNEPDDLNTSPCQTQLTMERLQRIPCPWEWRGRIRCACRALIRPIKSAPFILGGLWTSLYRSLFRQYSPDWPYKPNDWHQRQTAGMMRDEQWILSRKRRVRQNEKKERKE